MAGPGNGRFDGKDDPLPVKSKQDSLDWARQIIAHVAQETGARINPEPENFGFTPCIGRNGESAPDGRYTLDYGVHADVPDDQHNEVLRKARDLLTREGLKVTEYREVPTGDPSAQPIAAFSARHPESRYVIDVDSTAGHNRLSLVVRTPCLMPPPESAAPSEMPTPTP
ncbi:hypothetical protein [Streptomyces sp. CBMA156]|uniref:hypothetical protein n=1 Tax=Streptomyces sp. CBMA156 TaxID=1930280 RepID=UPI001661D12D|nr:hypothetical protein [Streptomyces sp. CBMA156]MBD0670114.1 hypothetical protein [Streptomyces sp. CBMA156]